MDCCAMNQSFHSGSWLAMTTKFWKEEIRMKLRPLGDHVIVKAEEEKAKDKLKSLLGN